MNFICDPGLVLYLPLHELDGSSFMSRDAYGHLCTATGAAWRPNGRYFDSIDDKIVIPSTMAGLPLGASDRTFAMWAKKDALAAAGYLLSYGAYVNAGEYFGWRQTATAIQLEANVLGAYNLGISMLADRWHFVAITVHSGDIVTAYVDLTRATETLGGNLDTQDSNLEIGVNRRTPNGYWDGYIGEVWCYNRTLDPLELQRLYLATKWRYR